MSRKREYLMDFGKGRIQVIGSKKDRPRIRVYMRIEDGDGNYVGSIDGSSLQYLRKALNEALSE